MTTKTKVAIAALAVAGSVFAFRKIRTLITAKEPDQKKVCGSEQSIDLNHGFRHVEQDACKQEVSDCACDCEMRATTR